MLHISRKIIIWKAKSIFNQKKDYPAIKDLFVASRSIRFMRRHGFSLRRKTATAQKGLSYMVNRIVASVMHVLQIQIQCNFHDADITAMDETSVWNEQVQKKSPWNRLGMIKSVFLFVWLGNQMEPDSSARCCVE